jgi:hypothetical protein
MTADNEHPVIDPNQAQRESVRRGIAQFQLRLQTAGHHFREPPPEPTTCCGRGCNGCVWESYEAALMWWYEEAGKLLTVTQKNQRGPTTFGQHRNDHTIR